MAWLYIPAETGERIETICNQHYNPGRGACDCPLWPPSTAKTGGNQHGIHRTQD